MRRLEDRLEARRSDQEFSFTDKERELQLREDNVHIREKDCKRREFDLENAEPLDGSSRSSDLYSK